MKITLNGGQCVDGDPSCPGPVHPCYRRRCPECETALFDNEDRIATERSIR